MMMVMTKIVATGLACLALCGSAAAASELPRGFSHLAQVQPAPQEGLQSLALPWAVLQASRSPGLADVRLFNAQGQVLPMAWAHELPAGEQQRRVSVPRFAWPDPASAAPGAAAALQLQLDAQGMVLHLHSADGRKQPAPGEARRWLLDLSQLQAQAYTPSQIRLDWPHRPEGLSSSARIEASIDGRAWQALPGAAQRLLQLPASEAAAPSLKTLDWPAGAPLPRYLRLQFDQPLALQASELLLVQRLAPADLQQALQFTPEPATQTSAQAAWQLDLQARIAPRALALQLPAGNHLLALRLEQRDAPEQAWRPVSRFVAWRMQQRGGVDASSPAQALPQVPAARYWRLAAEGPAAALQGQALPVQWHWQAPRLVFLAPLRPASLQLAVGRTKAMSPAALPLASLIPGYREGDEFKLPAAQLGSLSLRPEPGWLEQLAAPDADTRQRWLLWGVLIAAVAGLGALAWRLVRQLPEQG